MYFCCNLLFWTTAIHILWWMPSCSAQSASKGQDMNLLTPWALWCQLVGVSFFLIGILELSVLAVLAFYPLL